MCIFQKVKFEYFPEECHAGDYYTDGESNGQHIARMRKEGKARSLENARRNKAKEFDQKPGLKAVAEQQQPAYKPE